MNAAVPVNLHCHSNLSDGELSPEGLAERLAAVGVRVAALTDHDTVEGLEPFRKVLAKHGVGVVSGVELTLSGPDGESVHLLGYGFDPEHLELRRLLAGIWAHRRANSRNPRAGGETRWPFDRMAEPEDRPEDGGTPVDAAIGVLHRAGGLAFLAHPVLPGERQPSDSLRSLLLKLKEAGLDGIEAFSAGYSPATNEALLALAREMDLLVSGGTDFHGRDSRGAPLAVDFPADEWRRLKDALVRREPGTAQGAAAASPAERHPPRGQGRRAFLFRVLLPTLLAIVLFVAFQFWFLIPSFEDRLLERKRDMIRELTNVAFSILAEYEAEIRLGRLAEDEARRAAVARIQDLRYGDDGKDYFWITDLHPRMIMHPYRTDLNGHDLTGFQDPLGSRVFVEIVYALRDREEAYVEYVWQWKDDPDRLEPKQSFIKKFEPWGWIVGTGLYLDDVQREIGLITARLIQISAGISVLCALLLSFVAVQSKRIERRRQIAEEELHDSHDRYRALVESMTEGTLMVLDGRPAFANNRMLEMLDYRGDELSMLELADLFPPDAAIRGQGEPLVPALTRGLEIPRVVETGMLKRGGDRIEVALTATRIDFAGRDALVLTARGIGTRSGEAFPHRPAVERENLIGELQASLSFLHEPAAQLAKAPLFLDMGTPVSKAASLMTAAGTSAGVVTVSDQPVGIVTDHDLRARVLAAGPPADPAVFEIMTSPLICIDEQALVYEAILTMRERGVDHLPVRGEGGKVTGILHAREVLLYHRYSLAVLTQEIRHARTVEGIVEARAGLPKFVKALVDGGAKARNITRAVTSVADAVTVRLLDMGMDRLGPPPARFALLALGSQGREEQTLTTDQDQAVIFEDVPEEDLPGVRDYFVELGRFVSAGMAEAGYTKCPGKIMADNPRWCQPLRAWKKDFAGWLQTAEPRDILDLQIFFDFRTVFGASEFAMELRRHIDEALRREPPFLLHYAQYCLQYRSPIGFFGHLVLAGGKDGSKTFNIKEALLPVVGFARLYAFRRGVRDTNTLDRLHALVELGELKEALHDETVKAYEYVTQLRLSFQGRAVERGQAPGNEIDPKELTQLEENFLKRAFTQFADLQKKISYDFLGSA